MQKKESASMRLRLLRELSKTDLSPEAHRKISQTLGDMEWEKAEQLAETMLHIVETTDETKLEERFQEFFPNAKIIDKRRS